MNDDEIIQRLRTALDEVADTSAAVDAVQVGAPASHGNRWIAVAAAVALIGAATIVLLQHRASNDDTAAVSPSTTVVGSTAAVSTTIDTPRSTVPSNDVAWYTFDLPGFTAQAPQFDYCCKPWPAPGPDISMAWGDVRGIDHGLLLMRTKRSLANGPATFTFETSGLTKAQAVALEKQITPGSGLPYVLPDPSMQLLGNGLLGDGNLISQTWTSGGSKVLVTVGDYQTQLYALTRTTGWTTAPVAGLLAYRADDDMGSNFIWQTPRGQWATLHVDIELSKHIDEILAALRPAPAPSDPAVSTATIAPTGGAPGTYTAKGVSIIDSGKGPMIAFALADSLPPQGGNVRLANFDWSTVEGEHTAGGVTWGGFYDLTGTWDGTVFTLTQRPVVETLANTPSPPTRTATPDCSAATIAPMQDAMSKLDTSSLGLLSFGPDNWDGHCGLEVRAMFDTPALRAAMAKVGNDVVLTFAFQPVSGD